MPHSKPTDVPASTPWGAIQRRRMVVKGVVRITTASHGGYYVAPWKAALMPEMLRLCATFAGGTWYEEDCDTAIVHAAFPDELIKSDGDAYGVVKTMRLYHSGRIDLPAFFSTPAGADLLRRHDAFFAANSTKFRIASMGNPFGPRSSDWWGVSAVTLDGSQRIRFDFPQVPIFGPSFSEEDVISGGGIFHEDPKPSVPENGHD